MSADLMERNSTFQVAPPPRAKRGPKQSFSGDYLPGSVHTLKVRCGKPGCRCNRGDLHGPYHVRYWREGGKLRRQYLRADEVEDVRARCKRWRDARREIRQGREDHKQMMRMLRRHFRLLGV